MNARADIFAVLGMACCFPGGRDLNAYWHALLNGSHPFFSHSPTEKPHHEATGFCGSVLNTETLLTTIQHCIQEAMQDAGLSVDDPVLQRTKVSITIDTTCALLLKHAPTLQPDSYLADSLGMGTGQIEFAPPSTTDALEMLMQEIAQPQQSRWETLILVAVQSECTQDNTRLTGIPAASEKKSQPSLENTILGSVAAVVLERTIDKGTSGKPAYGLLGNSSTTESGLTGSVSDTDLRTERIGFLELTGRQRDGGINFDIPSLGDLVQTKAHGSTWRPMGITYDTIGVLGTTTGLASLIKVSLCINNKLIPPHWAPEDSQNTRPPTPFFLNGTPRSWIHDSASGPRQAFLGFMGPDEHMDGLWIQEIDGGAHSRAYQQKPINTDLDWDSELVIVTAKTRPTLIAELESLHAALTHMDPNEIRLVDLAFTQCLRFDASHTVRVAMVSKNLDEFMTQLSSVIERLKSDSPVVDGIRSVYYTEHGNTSPGKIAFIFPGHGFPGLLGPYIDHLRDLCLRFPEVRETFDLAEKRDKHPEDPVPTSHVFFPPSVLTEEERNQIRQRLASPRLDDANFIGIPHMRDLSVLGVFVANQSCWKLLQKLEVPVDAFFGQSLGELFALCAAGALDYKAVLPIPWKVEYDPDEFIKTNGRLLVVSAKGETLAPFLSRYNAVIHAIHVSPELQILGGEQDQLQEIARELKAASIWTQSLPYPAVHTPHFASMRPSVGEFLRSLTVHPFRVPVYSGMTCDRYPDDPTAILDIMTANLDNPVFLWQTHLKMYEDGIRCFIQAGGGATMYAQAKHNTGSDDVLAVSLDVDYRSATTQLNHLCGILTTNGIPVNLKHLYQYRSTRQIELPTIKPTLFHEKMHDDFTMTPSSDSSVHKQSEDSEVFLQQVASDSQDEPHMPFIGQCLHFIEGQEIIVDRVLSLQEDLFLHDHLFVKAKGVKPPYASYPTVPMTMSLELMAEVAAFLAPGCGLLGFEDVKAKRWIEMDHVDTITVRIKAALQHVSEENGAHRVKVWVFMAEQESPVIETIVVLGQSYLVEMDLEFSPLENPRPYPFTPHQIYHEEGQLFHGPAFQSLSGDCLLGDNHVLGELTVLPKDKMFRSTKNPLLLCDPSLLDAVGQLVGLWAIDKGVYLFPIGLKKLEIYCPTPPVGTKVPVYLEITKFSSHFIYANVEVQDGSGGVWMRIQQWGDWLFHWPENLFRFRCKPKKHCVSHALNLPALPEGAVSRWVTKKDLRDSDSHIMLLTIASFYLHMDEMSRFFELGQFPKRQFQWLLGRIAAKDAVRVWLAAGSNTETMLHPASFSIVNDQHGQPVVVGIPDKNKTPRLSISHTKDHAIAMVHSDPVGVDIEPIRPMEVGFLDTITSPRERKRLAQYLSSDSNTWTTRLWCAKEAAGKSLGTGLSGQPLKFEAMEVDAKGDIIIQDHLTGSRIFLRTHEQEDGDRLAIAYTTARLENPEEFQEQTDEKKRG